MQIIGCTSDGRAEKPTRKERQLKDNNSKKSLLLPLGWKGQGEKAVLPETRHEDQQSEPGTKGGPTARTGAMEKMHSLPEMP